MPEVPIRAFPLPPITPFSDTMPVMIQGKPCLFDESALLFLEVKPSDFSLTGVTKPIPKRKKSSKKRKGKDKAKDKVTDKDKGQSTSSTTQASSGDNETETLIKLLDDPLSLKSGFSADFPISLETWIKRKEIVLGLLQARKDGKIKFIVSDVSLAMAIWDLQERSGATPMAELTDLVRQVICKYAEKNQYVLNAGTFRIPGQTDAQYALRRLDPFLNLLALDKWCAEAMLHPDWKVLFIDYGERSAMLVPPSESERKK